MNEVAWPHSSLTTGSSACGCYDLGDDVVGSTSDSYPLLPVNTYTIMKTFTPL